MSGGAGGSGRPIAAPILIGVLYDFPQLDGGAFFETALRLGLADAVEGRPQSEGENPEVTGRPVELVPLQARGLPSGTAHDMEKCFSSLARDGVLAVVGPSISDNALIVRPMCEDLAVPCINYTGGEMTRSHWMFHYQVGSLSEEPIVLANHLGALNVASVAAAHDHSEVGQGYVESFAAACDRAGIELVGRAAVSALGQPEDVAPVVRRLRVAKPDAFCYLGLGVAARTVSLALAEEQWRPVVVANSSLMFGYQQRDWRAAWEGWTYTDTVSDHNDLRQRLRSHSRRTAAGPVGVAGYDIGRLLRHALERSDHLTRSGLRDGLERVKRLPAATGHQGTVMGFGCYDHGALKGEYLVLRRWEGGHTVEVGY